MIETIGYHGTTTESAQKILKENFKIPEVKKLNYWLGKGAYIFLEDIFAFKWCVHEYKRIYKKEFTLAEVNEMSIIEAKLEYDENRILDLTYFKGQSLFDETYNKILQSNKYSDELKKNPNYAACIVIDYMFDVLNFYKYYDLVKQIYRINIENYFGVTTKRESGIPQYQLCVKNNKIVKDRVIFDYIGNINNYIEQWNKLINVKPFINVNIIQNNETNSQEIQYINTSNQEIQYISDCNDNIIYIRGDDNE